MTAFEIGSRLFSDLQNELGITPVQAAGIVGNIAHETGGFKDLQEKKPLVGGSRGGYGFAQWTGSRRKAYEKWAAQNSLDPSSYEANKGFLVHELTATPEGKVLKSLASAQTPEEAALTFSNEFLRPGIPHNEKRVEWANKFAGNDIEYQQIQAPDGSILEFPTSMGDDEILAVMRREYPPTQEAAQPETPKSEQQPENFFQRTFGALGERIDKSAAAIERQRQGEQTLPETALQLGWQPVGAAGDVLGNLIISGYRALPDVAKPPIKEAGKILGKLPVAGTDETLGERLPKELGMLAQKYQDFAQERPRAAANVEALGGLATTFLPLKGTKTLMKPTQSVEKTLMGTGKTIKKVADAKIIKGIDDKLISSLPKPLQNMPLKETAEDAIQLAGKYNVRLGVDDLIPEEQARGFYMRAVKQGEQMPFSGGSNAINQAKDWNKALAKSLGLESTTRFTPKVMDDLFEKTGEMFDKLTKGKTFSITDDVLDNLSQMEDVVLSGQYGADAEKLFKRYTDDVFSRIKDNALDGDDLVKLRNRFAKLKRSGSNIDAQTLANDFEAFLIDMIGDDAPKELIKAKHRYKDLIVIEPLAVKAQSDGLINPSLLNSRVSQVYKRAHTRGKSGDIGELARLGQHIKQKLPDSGTAGRQSIMRTGAETTAALGSGFVNPALPLVYAAGKGTHILGNRMLQNYNVNAVQNMLNPQGYIAPSLRTLGAGLENTGGALGTLYGPAMTRGSALGVLREQEK